MLVMSVDKSEFIVERKVEMKKVLCILFAVLLLTFSLVGCSRYSSHYDTVGHVCSNDSDSAWMSFVEFEGTEVFKLKCKSKDQAIIVYSGKLEAGSLTVYYDCGGTKTELFSLRSGEDIQSAGGYLPKDTIYIIVETSEKCSNGNLSFEVMYG